MRRAFRLAVSAAVGLALALAVPAHATPPQNEPYEFSGEGVFFEGCPGGYDILIEFAGRGRTKFFFDQQGNVVRITDWAKGYGTLIIARTPPRPRRARARTSSSGTCAT